MWRVPPSISLPVENFDGRRKVMALSMKGTYKHNIDTKGRLIIPAKLRDSLGQSFVVTMGVDECLYFYSNDEWEIFTQRLDSQSNSKEEVRLIKRFFRSNAADVEMDSQGRVIIPQDLRDSIGITKEVVVVGAGEKAELWPRDVWDKNQSDPALSRENIKKLLENMDIDF